MKETIEGIRISFNDDKFIYISDKDNQKFLGSTIIFQDLECKYPRYKHVLELHFEDFNSLDLFVERLKRHRDSILQRSKGERSVRKKLKNIREHVLEIEKSFREIPISQHH